MDLVDPLNRLELHEDASLDQQIRFVLADHHAIVMDFERLRLFDTQPTLLDLVREGIGWFEGTGSAPARVPLSVTSGFSAGYAGTTTPGQVTICQIQARRCGSFSSPVSDVEIEKVMHGPVLSL